MQRKWYKQHGGTLPKALKEPAKLTPVKAVRPLEFYSRQEREQIDQCIALLEKWQSFRAEYAGAKSEADAAFIAQERLDVSIKTLYRRWAAYKSMNFDELVDNRGKCNKGKTEPLGSI